VNNKKMLPAFLTFIIVIFALFSLIFSASMYSLTNQLTSLVGWTSSDNGVPNWGGLILHLVVFIALGLLILWIYDLIGSLQ
jgi:uncharacterized membrane protein